MSFNVYVRFGMSYFVFGKVCSLCYVLFGITLMDVVGLGAKHHTIKALVCWVCLVFGFLLLNFYLFINLYVCVIEFDCDCCY